MNSVWLAASSVALLPSCSLLITSPESLPHQPLQWRQSTAATPVLTFSHGYHTGLTVPASSLRTHLPQLCEGLTNEWLEFGWGNEGFYRSEKVTPGLVLSAMCYPTPGVVHVAIIDPPIHRHYHYSPIRLLEVDESRLESLGVFLSDTFQRTENSELINLGPGRYGKSTFYRAKKSYYFPRSCNSWTAKCLQAGGFNVSAVTAPGLMRQLPE